MEADGEARPARTADHSSKYLSLNPRTAAICLSGLSTFGKYFVGTCGCTSSLLILSHTVGGSSYPQWRELGIHEQSELGMREPYQRT